MLRVTRRRSPDLTWQAFFVFLTVGIVLVAGYIQFNKTIGYQPQARYFFIILLPVALLLTGGIHTVLTIRFLKLAAVTVLLTGLALLNLLSLAIVYKAGPAPGGVRAIAVADIDSQTVAPYPVMVPPVVKQLLTFPEG